METIQLSPAIVVLVPIVVGLTQVVKTFIGDKFSPLVALALGVGGMFLLPPTAMDVTIFSGLVVGLTASGLYSGTKATIADLQG